ncbi:MULTISPECIES: hypothetical protein [unclassified Butyrivibrio]|uniref:hypothetical protein n=1 Tax=unclassified Butyrivibrio TaxID=2639466 RepID=UPI0003B3EE86|nr:MULTISPECIES: hypothetical protein [unclassified Butyrivibrio]SDB61222.1 hypothetical protein SAMN02910263_03255 [Butyrivibrio sp. INlla16]
MGTDANGLDPEQQALLASIMGKSSQQGAGNFSMPAATPAAAAAPPDPANSSKMLSQSEIDALIASMNK